MISIDLEELKRLYYDEQKSGFEIARHFQTFPQVIYNRMRKHGLQRRPCAEAQKLRYAKTEAGIRIFTSIDEIVHLYFEEKLTLKEVGARIGVSHATIQNRLFTAGYKCRTKGQSRHLCPSNKGTSMFTESELAEIGRLYSEEERSAHDIAFQYDCSDATIRNYLKRIGVQMRTVPEAQILRRKKEQAQAGGQHEASISRQLKQLPPLTPEQVTPDRVLAVAQQGQSHDRRNRQSLFTLKLGSLQHFTGGLLMNELTALQDACQYPRDERFIVDADCIEKLVNMELVIFYDGVYWVTYSGEAYARGEMC